MARVEVYNVSFVIGVNSLIGGIVMVAVSGGHARARVGCSACARFKLSIFGIGIAGNSQCGGVERVLRILCAKSNIRAVNRAC